MNYPIEPMDEYTLAAFMAGTLPRARREVVAEYLSKNADARELLQMAYEALEASRITDEEIEVPAIAFDAPPVARARHDRRPVRAQKRMQGITRFVAVAVVVFTVGVGLRLGFGPPTDALRSRQSTQALELAVHAANEGPVVHWNKIGDAYHYRVVVWDPQAAEVLARYETDATRLSANDEFIRSLNKQFRPGQSYTLRVDAFDTQNRLIQSSETVAFSLKR